MLKRLGKTANYWVPFLVLFFAMFLKIREPKLLSDFQDSVFDQFQSLRPRQYGNVPVRVLDIDDDSLEKLGQWPWPRTLLAELITRLQKFGAKAIVFDMVFSEPDRTSPSRIPELKTLNIELGRLPDHDAIFAQAISRGKVVLGFTFSRVEKKPQLKTQFKLTGADPRELVGSEGRAPGSNVNLPVLERAAAGNGNFSFAGGASMIRKAPMLMVIGDQLVPSLSLEALRVEQVADTIFIKSTGASGAEDYGQAGISAIKVGRYVIPTDEEGRVWLYDTGPVDKRTVPVWRIFEKKFDPAPIRGSIVFLGTSAPGLLDLRATPLSPRAPGVWVHAQMVEQAMTGEFLRRPYWAWQLELVYLLVLGTLLILLLPRFGAALCAALGGVSIAAALSGSWYAFSAFHYLFEPVMPSITVLLIYLSSSLISHIRNEAEKRQIRGAFAQYLSPVLVEQLAEHPEKLVLGGEMKEMTLLFTDIRGFTTISEKFADNPHGLTQLINGFLTPMTDVILGNRGTVDKYMGDCIMAFWNAPLDNPNHAADACRAALEMQRRLRELNRTWEEKVKQEGGTFVPIHTGVGINTGVCCVGNMGSQQRFDYSVLGDDVNLASRLEGQSKTYGVEIVVGENTHQKAPAFTYLELDLIRVKGKTKPVRIFALLGEEGLRKEEAFQELADLRQMVKPGLTGLWQVSGRSTTDYEQRCVLDCTYVMECSFWTDVQILLKTLPVVFERTGAY